MHARDQEVVRLRQSEQRAAKEKEVRAARGLLPVGNLVRWEPAVVRVYSLCKPRLRLSIANPMPLVMWFQADRWSGPGSVF